MSSDHRLKSLKYLISPKGDISPYSKKFKSVKDINVRPKEPIFNKSEYTNSLTNFDLVNNKPKSINISKHFPFIKNNFIITKKTDYYPDQKRDFEIKTLKKFHNYNFINTYDDEYLRKVFQLMKTKDKNYFKKRENIDKTHLALDDNNNLILTLRKDLPENYILKKDKSRKKLSKNQKETKDNNLIYKYININYEDLPQKDIRLPSDFEKNIPEFMDKSNDTNKEEDEIITKKIQDVLDETDSSIKIEDIRKDLFTKITKTHCSNKVLSLSKARFDNGKKKIDIFKEGNTLTQNSISGQIAYKTRKGSQNTFSNSSNITGINHNKSEGNDKVLNKLDNYKVFVEKIRRLTYSYHYLRKDSELKTDRGNDSNKRDINKCLKESDNLINRIIELDEKRVDKILKLKLKIEEDKNKSKIKMV